MRFWAISGFVAAVLAFCAPAALASGPTARATRVGPAPAAQQLQLVFPLTADLAGLQRFANAVTTPGSPDYGHYRSIPELARRFGAPAATRDSVARYLRAAGASDVKLDATGLFADATRPRQAGHEAVLYIRLRPITRHAKPGSLRPPQRLGCPRGSAGW